LESEKPVVDDKLVTDPTGFISVVVVVLVDAGVVVLVPPRPIVKPVAGVVFDKLNIGAVLDKVEAEVATILEALSAGLDDVNEEPKFNWGKPVDVDEESAGFVSVSVLGAVTPRFKLVKLVEPDKPKEPVVAEEVGAAGAVVVAVVELGVVVDDVKVVAGEPNKPAEGVDAPRPPPRLPPSLKPPPVAPPPNPKPELDEVDVVVVVEGAVVVAVVVDEG